MGRTRARDVRIAPEGGDRGSGEEHGAATPMAAALADAAVGIAAYASPDGPGFSAVLKLR